MSLTTYAFQHPPVEPTEAGAAGQHLLAHRVEVEGFAWLLDVLNVDHPAAIRPADEHIELDRHQGCPPGPGEKGSITAWLCVLLWLGRLANYALPKAL